MYIQHFQKTNDKIESTSHRRLCQQINYWSNVGNFNMDLYLAVLKEKIMRNNDLCNKKILNCNNNTLNLQPNKQ
jgi:hypothetical protein